MASQQHTELNFASDFLKALKLPPPSYDPHTYYQVRVRKEEAEILENLLRGPHFAQISMDEQHRLFQFSSPHDRNTLCSAFETTLKACEKYKHSKSYEAVNVLAVQLDLSKVDQAKKNAKIPLAQQLLCNTGSGGKYLPKSQDHPTKIAGELVSQLNIARAELRKKQKQLESAEVSVADSKKRGSTIRYDLNRVRTSVRGAQEEVWEIEQQLAKIRASFDQISPAAPPRIPVPLGPTNKKKALISGLVFFGATGITAAVGIPLGFAKKSTETAQAFHDVADAFRSLNNPRLITLSKV